MDTIRSVCVVLCFIFVVGYVNGISDCSNHMILHPRTTVALSNKTAYFSCYDNETASDKQITLNINGDMFVNNEQENIDKGINRDFIVDENNKEIGFNISIIATEENNNTVIQCFFSPCFSNQAFLIVVEASPTSPDAPIVTIINLTTFNISWSSPWTYPVNNYTLFITNNNTGITINYTTVNTQYIVYDEDNSECNVLEFTVSANTDVGNSGLSEKTVKRFPKYMIALSISSSMSMFSLTFSPTVSPTIHESKKPVPIIIIVAAVGGGVLVMALIIIIIAICCAVVKKQIKKERSTGTTADGQIGFSLPSMVPNEHYVNPHELVYDFIPNIKNLTPVEKQIPSPISPTAHETDAPLLPPPRSPKIPFYSQVCNQGLSNPPLQSTQEDEYVEMTSRSAAHTAPIQSHRYMKGPSTAFFNGNSLTHKAQMHNTSTLGTPDSHIPFPDEPSITAV